MKIGYFGKLAAWAAALAAIPALAVEVGISNCDGNVDQANLSTRNNPQLKIPYDWHPQLPSGTEIDVDEINFVPAQTDGRAEAAVRITLEVDGQKLVSNPVVLEDGKLKYDFDRSFRIAVGERYNLGFLDGNGEAMPLVRYAVTDAQRTLVVNMGLGGKWHPMVDVQGKVRNMDPIRVLAFKPVADGLGGNDNGVYRIPALAVSDDGVALAVYDCRYWSSYDLPGAIDLAENYSCDFGDTWTAPRLAVDVANTDRVAVDKEVNIGDPCLVYVPGDDKFMVMGITGGGLAQSHVDGKSVTDLMVGVRGTRASDKWEDLRLVKGDILAAMAAVDPEVEVDENKIRTILEGPGHGIVQRKTVTDAEGKVLMRAGTVIFPMQYFPTSDFAYAPKCFAVYTEDLGQTWRATKITPEGHPAQENCVVELDDGSWVMMCKGFKREFFRTRDFVNWTWEQSLEPSAWVQGSILRLGTAKDGRGRYAACFSPAGRADITLHFGRDNSAGEGPGIIFDCGKENIFPETTCGYSYNSLIMTDEHTIGILFESKGRIYWRTLDVSSILGE